MPHLRRSEKSNLHQTFNFYPSQGQIFFLLHLPSLTNPPAALPTQPSPTTHPPAWGPCSSVLHTALRNGSIPLEHHPPPSSSSPSLPPSYLLTNYEPVPINGPTLFLSMSPFHIPTFQLRARPDGPTPLPAHPYLPTHPLRFASPFCAPSPPRSPSQSGSRASASSISPAASASRSPAPRAMYALRPWSHTDRFETAGKGSRLGPVAKSRTVFGPADVGPPHVLEKFGRRMPRV